MASKVKITEAMTSEQKVDEVLFVLLGLIRRESITPTARVREDLGADSLGLFEIASELEDYFPGLSLETEDVRRLRTVQDIYNFVNTGA